MILFLNVIEDDHLRCLLEDVYLLYKKELTYIANDILHDYHEAEDVVQTAVIKFSDYLDKNLDPKCHKTKALIVIIVRNLSINIYNQRKNRKTVKVEELDDYTQEDPEMMPDISIIRLDQSREMAKRLSDINAGYADILTLKYVFEYDNDEIADILLITEANVRKRLSRARKALKKIIEGDDSYEWS